MSGELFPIECFGCQAEIGHLYDRFIALANSKPAGGELAQVALALNDLGITRDCCRRMFICNPDPAIPRG
jgi:DNA-directed RNA polymerase subunit N (RpoN/RPB10)